MANGGSPAGGALSTLLLSVAVAALAIAVVILAWLAFGGLDDLLTKEEFRKRLDAVDAAHGEIKESVDQLGERIDDLEQLIGRCCKGRSGSSGPSEPNPRLGVMFENARLSDGALSRDNDGIALSGEESERLGKLAAALAACAAPAQVRLKVQGYSSTRKFRGASNSDELNLLAANLRAEVVKARLAANNVDVRHVPWQSYAEIRRPFEDAQGFSGMAQEQLNRVVYIEVQDAGGCERHV